MRPVLPGRINPGFRRQAKLPAILWGMTLRILREACSVTYLRKSV